MAIYTCHSGKPDTFDGPTLEEFTPGAVGRLHVDYSGQSKEPLDAIKEGDAVLIFGERPPNVTLIAIAQARSAVSGHEDSFRAWVEVEIIEPLNHAVQSATLKQAADARHFYVRSIGAPGS